jgi:hypothetical protein
LKTIIDDNLKAIIDDNMKAIGDDKVETIIDDNMKTIIDDNMKTIVDDNFRCSKCKRDFTRKDHLKVHEKKCDGFYKKQCKICLRMFVTPQGKYQHNKYVKCNPPPIIV